MSTLLPPAVIVSTLTTGQGPSGAPGAPGGAGAVYTAASALSGHAGVLLNANGQADYASAATLWHAMAFAGITQGAAALGAPASVLRSGPIEHGGWAWVPGQPVYLGLAGALVQSLPVGALFALVVGSALSSTRLLVNPQPPIVLT